MKSNIVLEIAVESVAAAQAAERGGANRIELCAELACGGLTPSAEMMVAARGSVNIPMFAMIRPRPGDFFYSAGEFRAMQRGIKLARELKMDGVVLGVLREGFKVDLERTRDLVQQARPLQVTFHRAFDACVDLLAALDDVVECGVDRILTSGGKPDVVGGLSALQAMVVHARQRIVVMPGGGITPDNFVRVQEVTEAREFHSGLGKVLEYGSTNLEKFEEEVGKLVSLKQQNFFRS